MKGPQEEIKSITKGFAKYNYICNEQLATAMYLAAKLEKPILVEGPPGVGKTELANTAAKYYKKSLFRLQCYEGLDESKSLYEWRYGKQLLYTQILKEQMQEVLEGATGLRDSLNRLSPWCPFTFVKSQTDFQKIFGLSTDHRQILSKSLAELTL